MVPTSGLLAKSLWSTWREAEHYQHSYHAPCKMAFSVYIQYTGAVEQWLSMWTHNTGVVRLIPPCVTLKTSLVRKATGKRLMNSTSLEKTQSPVSGFCYA